MLGIDVTGSMGDWSKIIYDKLPMFYGQLLVQDYVLCLRDPSGDSPAGAGPGAVLRGRRRRAGAGPRAAAGHGLRARQRGAPGSARGPGCAWCPSASVPHGSWPAGEVDGELAKLWLEGRGGGNRKEGYDLCAFFYAARTAFAPGATPFLFLTGDEGLYTALAADTVRGLVDPEAEGVRAGASGKEAKGRGCGDSWTRRQKAYAQARAVKRRKDGWLAGPVAGPGALRAGRAGCCGRRGRLPAVPRRDHERPLRHRAAARGLPRRRDRARPAAGGVGPRGALRGAPPPRGRPPAKKVVRGKFHVFHLRKPFSSERAEPKMLAQWQQLVGPHRVRQRNASRARGLDHGSYRNILKILSTRTSSVF
jgi:hypothetical protein